MPEPAVREHRVAETDVQHCLSGPSESLACVCGWYGHRTMWNSQAHAARIPGAPVPGLPAVPEPPRASRDQLRTAIYGERRDPYRTRRHRR
ncbi:MAG: hypothetical protein ACRDPY_13225 [Streptosporangiaceae bacterium]